MLECCLKNIFKKMDIELIKLRLGDTISFLKPFLPLTNSHMVNFITENLWTEYVPTGIKTEIESIGFCKSIEYFLESYENIPSELHNIKQFVRATRENSLSFMPTICTSRSQLTVKLREWGCGSHNSLQLDQFMSYKKSHEVAAMSEIVAALACKSSSTCIIDIGGGKGYLSSMLAMHHGLPVLGIDSSQVVTHGAIKRIKKLEKAWNGVSRRAECIEKGEIPPKRGKHWKSQKDYSTDNCAKSQVVSVQSEEANLCGFRKCKSSIYKQETVFVMPDTDIIELARKAFGIEMSASCSAVLVGLHTCGNLAPTCLQLFVNSPHIQALCNVGCCYHLTEEMFSPNPFGQTVSEQGFPMSQFLCNIEFTLGRNTRMLASQPRDRILCKQEVPSQPLYYRALLQVLLEKHCSSIPWGSVGRLAKKCNSFHDYAFKALKKLEISFEPTLEELDSLLHNHSVQDLQLQVYFLLRVSLAPVIETVILLDRLLFLLEKGYHDSFVVQIFDPLISPRGYGILSIKS